MSRLRETERAERHPQNHATRLEVMTMAVAHHPRDNVRLVEAAAGRVNGHLEVVDVT